MELEQKVERKLQFLIFGGQSIHPDRAKLCRLTFMTQTIREIRAIKI